MKYRIRQKGNKHILQKGEGNKWESRTLNLEKLWSLLEVSQNMSRNVSSIPTLPDKTIGEKFLQSSLNEPDAEAIKRTLEEVGL